MINATMIHHLALLGSFAIASPTDCVKSDCANPIETAEKTYRLILDII